MAYLALWQEVWYNIGVRLTGPGPHLRISMSPRELRQFTRLERISIRATRWVGSTQSLAVHTILFTAAFVLVIFGFSFDKILLVVTTIVSLEAIYLSIFIQMSVNRQGKRLREVSKDIEEIQEDVEEIAEDVEGIEKDVEEIAEDVEGIEKDVDEIQRDVEEIQEDVEGIEEEVSDTEETTESTSVPTIEKDRFQRIESTLQALLTEISDLKKKD